MRSARVARLTRLSAVLVTAGMICLGCASAPTPEAQAESFVADYRAAVSDIVADAARQQSAEATVDEMADQLTRFHEELRAIQSDLFDLNANYDAAREEFEARFRRAEELRHSVGERMIELGLELRRQTTADEWQRIHAELSDYRAEEGK